MLRRTLQHRALELFDFGLLGGLVGGQLSLAESASLGGDLTMADLPTGTVTLLFSDIEGSTRLWEAHAS